MGVERQCPTLAVRKLDCSRSVELVYMLPPFGLVLVVGDLHEIDSAAGILRRIPWVAVYICRNHWQDMLVAYCKRLALYGRHLEHAVDSIVDSQNLARRAIWPNKKVSQTDILRLLERPICHEDQLCRLVASRWKNKERPSTPLVPLAYDRLDRLVLIRSELH